MTTKKQAVLYSRSDMQRERDVPGVEDYRSGFRRDYARLLHSPAFRRLQGKTQLYPGTESDFFRNRLTHSLEVAQIAKGIAERLNATSSFFKKNPLDTDLIEFAGLAHDLGHPPFGHNGELALDSCMKFWGGFEGNAQTLRLLSKVEKKDTRDDDFQGIKDDGEDSRLGLNLTYRSLAAILKYDRQISEHRKPSAKLEKGYYSSEADLVARIKKKVAPLREGDNKFKTVECQIMDFADDIAYSTYDLEDGLKGEFFDPLSILSVLRTDTKLLERVTLKVRDEVPSATHNQIVKAIADVFAVNMDGLPKGTKKDDANVLAAYSTSKILCTNGYARSALTSSLINKFIRGIEVKVNLEMPMLSEVLLDKDLKLQVEALKHLNYEMTIMSPRLKLVEYRGFDIVQGIFEALSSDDGYLLLPQDYRIYHSHLKTEKEKMRLICDFVAGMTDRYAVEFFARLRDGAQSIFKPF